MKRPLLSFTGVVLVIFAALFVTSSVAQNNDCACEISLLPSARYPQGSTVTVYMDTSNLNTASGFSQSEIDAIEAGIRDWNGQPNNANITYTFVRTPNPPSPPASHAIIVNFSPPISSAAVADVQPFSYGPGSGTVVYHVMRFHGNIRVGDPATLFAFVRGVARHETAHTLGLDNSDCVGSVTYRQATGIYEISDCDNRRIKNTRVSFASATTTNPLRKCVSQQQI